MEKNAKVVIARSALKTFLILLGYVAFFSGVFFYWFISNPERIFTLQGLVVLFSLSMACAVLCRFWREMMGHTLNSGEHSHDSESS